MNARNLAKEAVYGFFGKLMELAEGSYHIDPHAVLVKEAHVFHVRDGEVVEFWNAATDMYAYDELIG